MKNFDAVEIYPKIVVYKNCFEDIAKTYSIFKNSMESDNIYRFFEPWSQWSTFGQYLNPISKKVDWENKNILESINNVNSSFDQEEKDLTLELMTIFQGISEDYSSRYNLNINLEENVLGHNGEEYSRWRNTAPTICEYKDISYVDRKMTMRYHSDYIREPMISPGYKFTVTALAYFNDSYEGGEIEFVIGNKLVKYKPSAGDFVLFPSGNPDILTENGEVYLHGVHPITSGENKLFLRMFWQTYEVGEESWFNNEQEFGKESWDIKYQEILQDFRKANPQRNHIENSIKVNHVLE
jgi:hemerythrin-like domain-containing protein